MKIIKVVDTDGLRLLKGKMDIMKMAMKELAEEMKKKVDEELFSEGEYTEEHKEYLCEMGEFVFKECGELKSFEMNETFV